MRILQYIIISAVSLGVVSLTALKALPEFGVEIFHSDREEQHQDDRRNLLVENADDESQKLVLNAEEIRRVGIKTQVARPGLLEREITLPGEITLNQDRMAHIVPRAAGVVRQVNFSLGDEVREGQVMAVLESRDLADAKAAYLAALEKVKLIQTSFQREQRLFSDKVTSEQEYLSAAQALKEAEIQAATASQKLMALGFTKGDLEELPSADREAYRQYMIKAPFDGTVIEKHIVLGEVVDDKSEVFTLADLTTVWVDLHVYQSDISSVRQGQSVTISSGSTVPDAAGIIDYVGAVLGRESRTLLARILLPNPGGIYRPGLFVTATVRCEQIQTEVAIPRTAVQFLNGKSCVFARDEHGFEPVEVRTGRTDGRTVEILSGLQNGRQYVSEGAFELKARLITGTLDDHAGHGH
jgi:cobalt-zinc-cadmium efflux system membrane fusion protein